jgi:hypothetical protein
MASSFAASDERLDATQLTTLDHPCAQIKSDLKTGYLRIPDKYHELLLEHLDDDEDVEQLPATQATWERIQAMFVAGFWLDTWYTDGGLPTPRTTFLDWPETEEEDDVIPIGSSMPFVRLVSLSSKTAQPYASWTDALDDLATNPRCEQSRAIARKAGHEQPPCIALREWIDLRDGKAYRCVIFEGRLVRIVAEDASRISTLTQS